MYESIYWWVWAWLCRYLIHASIDWFRAACCVLNSSNCFLSSTFESSNVATLFSNSATFTVEIATGGDIENVVVVIPVGGGIEIVAVASDGGGTDVGIGTPLTSTFVGTGTGAGVGPDVVAVIEGSPLHSIHYKIILIACNIIAKY